MGYKTKIKFPVITTDRLILRQLNENDLEDIYNIFSCDELMGPYGMYPLDSKEKAVKFLNNLIEDQEWGFLLKEEGKLIGTIGFVDYNLRNRRAEIGFELLKEYWGKGYMTEALRAILKFAFTDTDLNRIEAFIYPSNIASQAVVEKVGFIREGLLKERNIKRGEFKDYYLYGIIKRLYKYE